MAKRRDLPTYGPMPAVSTPCIRVCVLDPQLGLCAGCGRTPDEIARWTRLDEPERRRIMAGLETRLHRARDMLGAGIP